MSVRKQVDTGDILLVTAIALLSVGLAGFTVGPVAADTAEEEPNDDFDTAQDISEGEIAGAISDGESDFYRIEANDTDALDVEATAESGDIDLRIFGPDRDQVAGATGFSSDKRVTAKAPETGTFFIEVAGKQDRTTTDYTLRVDKVTPSENDPFAPNDGFESATTVPEGFNDATIWGGESDFYRIEANDTDALDVEATAESGDIDLRIFDPDRNQVAGATGFSREKRVTAKAPETGTFYIEVAGKQEQTTTDYTLRVDKVTPSENDPFAPNDGFASAAAIEDQFSDATIWGGESDFYRVGLNAGEGLDVEATAESGDIDLRIFDPDRDQVAGATGFSRDKSLTITATETGNYFVEVAGKQRQTTTEYELQSNQTGSFDAPSVTDYANADGIVTTDGLRDAIDDWRSDDIGTDILRNVIDAWRSGDPVG